jgi:hypothetical protein
VPRGLIKGRAFLVYWSFDQHPPAGTSLRERLGELGKVVIYFFQRTRWKRTFFIIDSKYHYTPGVTAYGHE